MAPNLWQFQLYIIFNMPIEICGKTREFENRRGKNNRNNNNENKSDINKCWAYFLWQVCAALAALFFFVTLAPEWPTGLRVQFRVRDSVSGLSMPSNRRRSLEELPSSSPTAVRGGGQVLLLALAGISLSLSRISQMFTLSTPQSRQAGTRQRPRAKCHWNFNVLMKMRAKRKARAAKKKRTNKNMLKILWNCYKNSRAAVAAVAVGVIAAVTDIVLIDDVVVAVAFDSRHELIMAGCGF